MIIEPMFASERPFVFFAATDFSTCLSGRTRRLAEALSEVGFPVTFVELPSARRILTDGFRTGVRTFTGSSVRVMRVPPLPGHGRKSSSILEEAWCRHVARAMQRRIPHLDGAVLITSTPWWSGLVPKLPCAARCYDCVDHLSVQAGPGRWARFLQWENELLASSDLVSTVSRPLYDDLVQRRDPDRVFLIPNGVADEWMQSRIEPVSRSTLGCRSDRPLAGFVGSLFEWVDVDLLLTSARALPHVEFVLVGPRCRSVQLGMLRSLPNVHVLDPVPYERVPHVVQAFDVGLIPFKQDLVSECADPLKLYEYCSQGKPVVSSVRFCNNEETTPIIVAEGRDDFIAAIPSTVVHDTPEQRADRIAFARRHTWRARGKALLDAVDHTLSVRGPGTICGKDRW